MGGWLYSDYNASLSSNWTELDWTGTELGNKSTLNFTHSKSDLRYDQNRNIIASHGIFGRLASWGLDSSLIHYSPGFQVFF